MKSNSDMYRIAQVFRRVVWVEFMHTRAQTRHLYLSRRAKLSSNRESLSP